MKKIFLFIVLLAPFITSAAPLFTFNNDLIVEQLGTEQTEIDDTESGLRSVSFRESVATFNGISFLANLQFHTQWVLVDEFGNIVSPLTQDPSNPPSTDLISTMSFSFEDDDHRWNYHGGSNVSGSTGIFESFDKLDSGLVLTSTETISLVSVTNTDIQADIPIPSAIWLFGTGFLGLLKLRKKSKDKFLIG